MTKKPPYYEKMASGAYAIVLESGVAAETFSLFAERWARRLSLTVQNKIETGADCVWDCELNGRQYWLAWDNWFPLISLEPQNAEAGKHITAIGASIGISVPPQANLKPET